MNWNFPIIWKVEILSLKQFHFFVSFIILIRLNNFKKPIKNDYLFKTKTQKRKELFYWKQYSRLQVLFRWNKTTWKTIQQMMVINDLLFNFIILPFIIWHCRLIVWATGSTTTTTVHREATIIPTTSLPPTASWDTRKAEPDNNHGMRNFRKNYQEKTNILSIKYSD